METEKGQQEQFYLTCEKYYIFELLIFAAGMMGAYTYLVRGGVFCNAQTANVLMMALAFGRGQGSRGLYYFIPFTAYVLGAMVSEVLPTGIRHRRMLRWDTLLIGFEMLVLFLLGLVPSSWPVMVRAEPEKRRVMLFASGSALLRLKTMVLLAMRFWL